MAWRTDFHADLAAIKVPTLVVHGDRDQVPPVEATGTRTAELLADATLVLIEGGPHAVYATNPEHPGAALDRFLHVATAVV